MSVFDQRGQQVGKQHNEDGVRDLTPMQAEVVGALRRGAELWSRPRVSEGATLVENGHENPVSWKCFRALKMKRVVEFKEARGPVTVYGLTAEWRAKGAEKPADQ